MGFRVEIQDPAIADLAEIVSYVAQDNPDAARTLGNALLDVALSLSETPYKGSPYSRFVGVRKLTLRPFKIFYRVSANNATQVLCHLKNHLMRGRELANFAGVFRSGKQSTRP